MESLSITTALHAAVSGIDLGIIAQSDRNNTRFDYTYSALKSGKLSRSEFEENYGEL